MPLNFFSQKNAVAVTKKASLISIIIPSINGNKHSGHDEIEFYKAIQFATSLKKSGFKVNIYAEEYAVIDFVITSYSIHYTKLYDELLYRIQFHHVQSVYSH